MPKKSTSAGIVNETSRLMSIAPYMYQGNQNQQEPVVFPSQNPDYQPLEYYSTLPAAGVTAPLPEKFNGSQEAARRYAEGYQWGQRNVRDPRERVAPYVAAGMGATFAAPLALDAVASASAAAPGAFNYLFKTNPGRKALWKFGRDMVGFEAANSVPKMFSDRSATGWAGYGARSAVDKWVPDDYWLKNEAADVADIGAQLLTGAAIGGGVHNYLEGVSKRGVEAVLRMGDNVRSAGDIFGTAKNALKGDTFWGHVPDGYVREPLRKRIVEALKVIKGYNIHGHLSKQFLNKNTLNYVFNPYADKNLAYNLPIRYSGESGYFPNDAHPGDVIDQFLGKARMPNEKSVKVSNLPSAQRRYFEERYPGIESVRVGDLGAIDDIFTLPLGQYNYDPFNPPKSINISSESTQLLSKGMPVLDPGGHRVIVGFDSAGKPVSAKGYDIYKYNSKDWAKKRPNFNRGFLGKLRSLGLDLIESETAPMVYNWAYPGVRYWDYGGEINRFFTGGNKEDREERKRIDAVTRAILEQYGDYDSGNILSSKVSVPATWGTPTMVQTGAINQVPKIDSKLRTELGIGALGLLGPAAGGVAAELSTFGPLYKQAAKTLLTDIPAFEVIDRLPELWDAGRLTEGVGSGVEKGVRYIMPDGKAENIIAPTLGTIARFAAGIPIGGVSHLMSQNVGNIMNATADAAGRIAQDNIVRRATNSLLPVEEIYGAAEREVPALMAEPAAQNAAPIYEAYRRAINMPERFSNPWVGFRAPSERFAEPTYRYIEGLTPEQIEGINLGLNPGDPGYIDLNLNRIAAGVNMRRTARQSVDDYIARLSEARWPRDVSAADRARNSRYDRFLNFNLPETSRNYRPTSVTPDGIPDDARALAARRNAVNRTFDNVNELRQRLGQPPISGQPRIPSQTPASSGSTQQPSIVGNVFADRYGIMPSEFERLVGPAPNGRERNLHELMQTARNLETEAGGLENLRTMLSEGRLPGSPVTATPTAAQSVTDDFQQLYGVTRERARQILESHGINVNSGQSVESTLSNLETAATVEGRPLSEFLQEGRLPGYSSTSAAPGTPAGAPTSSAAAASSVAGRRPFSLADTEAEYTALSDEFRANRYKVSEATINDYKRRAADILEREAKAYADSIPDEELVGTLTDAISNLSANEYYSGHTGLTDILMFRGSHSYWPSEIKSRALGKAVKERLLKVPGTNTKINSENLINAYSLPDEELTALKDYFEDGRVLRLADTLGLADDMTSESFGGARKLADYIDNIDYIKDFINAAKSDSPLPQAKGIKIYRQRDARDYLYNTLDHLKLSASDKSAIRKSIEADLDREAGSSYYSEKSAWDAYFSRARAAYRAEAPQLSANNSTSYIIKEGQEPVMKAKLKATAKSVKKYLGDREGMPDLDIDSVEGLAKVQKYVRENKLVPDNESLPLDIAHMSYFAGSDPKLSASAGLKAVRALEQYLPGMANTEYNTSIASTPMRPRAVALNYGENPGEASAIFLKDGNGDYMYKTTNTFGKERLLLNDDGTIETARSGETARTIKKYGKGLIDPSRQYLTSDEVRLLKSGDDGSQEYKIALEKWKDLAKKMDSVALNKMLRAQETLKAAALEKGYNLDVPMARLRPDSYYEDLKYNTIYNPRYDFPFMMLLKHDMGGPLLRDPYANGSHLNSFPNGGKFITTLPSNKEDAFQKDWQAYASLHNLAMNPDDPEHYYDYRGFWDTNKKSSAVNPFTWETKSTDGHLPDTWKTPGHPTFSGESVYAKDAPGLAGSWENGVYIPPAKVDQDTIKFLQRYAESSFNDAAVSDAGAIGAYQLMPDTANEHALRLGIDGDLFDPTYNEALRDSAYNQFYNSDIATSGYPTDINRTLRALLMYNAGWGRARTILRNLAEKGYDINGSTDWVDAIPYKESRNYLKFVGLQQDIPGTGFTRAQLEKAAKAHGYTIPTPVDAQKVSKAYGMLKKACGGDITRMRAMFNKIKS